MPSKTFQILAKIDKAIEAKEFVYKRITKAIFTIAIILSTYSFAAKFINDQSEKSFAYQISYVLFYGYFYYIIWIVLPAFFCMLFIGLYLKIRKIKDWFHFIKTELFLFSVWLLTFIVFLLCIYVKVDFLSGIH